MSTLTINPGPLSPASAAGRAVQAPARIDRRRPAQVRPVACSAQPICLTRRGRLALLLLLLVTLATAAALFVRAPATAGPPSVAGASTGVADRLTVRPGETLWQIAQRVAPTDDPRAMVSRIKEMNGLPSSAIQAGRVLLVPAG